MEKGELEKRVRKLEHENYVLKHLIYFNSFKPEFWFSSNSEKENELIAEFNQIMDDFKKGLQG